MRVRWTSKICDKIQLNLNMFNSFYYLIVIPIEAANQRSRKSIQPSFSNIIRHFYILLFQAANEDNTSSNWMQRQFSKVTRNLRYRISGEGNSKTPDWFLDKFAAQTFTDPEEPLYQAKRSKLLCGLKLAFDPTLPGHYHVSNNSFY